VILQELITMKETTQQHMWDIMCVPVK